MSRFTVVNLRAMTNDTAAVQALREMARVVRPGGTVVVADEVPDLPNRQLAHKLGLPRLQKWILARVFFLGRMSEVILEHTNLKIEPLVDQALHDWTIHRIWGGLGYCVVGKAGVDKTGPEAAAKRTDVSPVAG